LRATALPRFGRSRASVASPAAVDFSLVAGVAMWYSGKAAGRTEVQVEAVKNSHGHYKIVDELGHTQFEWGPGAPGTAILPK
jgi:hypothetical protein